MAAGRFQHRQVTRDQLRAAGLSDDAIKYRIGLRRLHPVFAEVFSLGGPPQTPREVTTPSVIAGLSADG